VEGLSIQVVVPHSILHSGQDREHGLVQFQCVVDALCKLKISEEAQSVLGLFGVDPEGTFRVGRGAAHPRFAFTRVPDVVDIIECELGDKGSRGSIDVKKRHGGKSQGLPEARGEDKDSGDESQSESIVESISIGAKGCKEDCIQTISSDLSGCPYVQEEYCGNL
jgi:hypothetical protein